MKQVLRGNLFYFGFGALVLSIGLIGLPRAMAQVEGRESPRFGPTPAPSTPTAPVEPAAPPTVPAPMPGDQVAPAPEPAPAPGPAQEGPGAAEAQPYVPTPTPVEEQIKLGRELIEQGKVELALQHFEEATKLAAEPVDKADAFFHLGNALRTLSRFDDAIDAYTLSIMNKDDDPEAYLRRGIVWFHKGEYGIAWEDFEDAAAILREVDEPYPELWKGLAKASQGDWLDAVDSYAIAILKDPRFSLAYANRGLAYLQLNEPDKAVLDFDQAIRHDPRNPVHYFRRGIAQTQMGRTSAAVESYNQAIRLDPNYAEAKKNRGMLAGRAGR